MAETFFSDIDDEGIKKEKERARQLRGSPWWKRQKSKGLCHYCGGRFKSTELTMDHIVPIIRGGRSVKGNVVPCCKACNTDKKAQLLMEWDTYRNSVR